MASTIFFVISGYLITRLLLHEQQTRGTISMWGFYLKRAFRILPPLYVYIGVLALLSAAGRLVLTKWDSRERAVLLSQLCDQLHLLGH